MQLHDQHDHYNRLSPKPIYQVIFVKLVNMYCQYYSHML